MTNLNRVERIRIHPLYQDSLQKIRLLEQDRIFCSHSFSHSLDVARIAYLEALENHLAISKDLIYAAALLHDIGRHLQYSDGIPHDAASARIAGEILPACDFTEEETAAILHAITAHRITQTKEASGLAGLLYRADKKSRCCYSCPVKADCSWPDTKKNLTLII